MCIYRTISIDLLKERYGSFKSSIGLQISNGLATLDECENFINQHGEPGMVSGKQEHCESIFNHYI